MDQHSVLRAHRWRGGDSLGFVAKFRVRLESGLAAPKYGDLGTRRVGRFKLTPPAPIFIRLGGDPP